MKIIFYLVKNDYYKSYNLKLIYLVFVSKVLAIVVTNAPSLKNYIFHLQELMVFSFVGVVVWGNTSSKLKDNLFIDKFISTLKLKSKLLVIIKVSSISKESFVYEISPEVVILIFGSIVIKVFTLFNDNSKFVYYLKENNLITLSVNS